MRFASFPLMQSCCDHYYDLGFGSNEQNGSDLTEQAANGV